MKCISLWQPWATLMVIGSKQIETRSWFTTFRGPLLIHAAKRQNKSELEQIATMSAFDGALYKLGGIDAIYSLPLGAIIGRVTMFDCLPTEDIHDDISTEVYPPDWFRHGLGSEWSEDDLGNFDPDRWGWFTKDQIQFTQPIPYKGMQGIFDVPDSVLVDAFEVFGE